MAVEDTKTNRSFFITAVTGAMSAGLVLSCIFNPESLGTLEINHNIAAAIGTSAIGIGAGYALEDDNAEKPLETTISSYMAGAIVGGGTLMWLLN